MNNKIFAVLVFVMAGLSKGIAMELTSPSKIRVRYERTLFGLEMLVPQIVSTQIPVEISRCIFPHINDGPSKAAYWATCRGWKAVADEYFRVYYTQKNKEERIVPWQDYPDLSPRMLNYLNREYLYVLGMSRNLKFYVHNNVDKILFDMACQHIMDAPFVAKESFIKSYVEMLQLMLEYNLSYSAYTVRSTTSKYVALRTCADEYGFKMDLACNDYNTKHQNEMALRIHYISLIWGYYQVCGTYPSFIDKMTCNLIDVVKYHRKIKALRDVKDKTVITWKGIVALESAPLYNDYKYTGANIYSVGKINNNYDQMMQGLILTRKAKDLERKAGISISDLFLIENLVTFSYGTENYEECVQYLEEFFEQMDLQKDNAKDHAVEELKFLDYAANTYEILGNEERALHYNTKYKILESVRKLAENMKTEEEASSWKNIFKFGT